MFDSRQERGLAGARRLAVELRHKPIEPLQVVEQLAFGIFVRVIQNPMGPSQRFRE